MALIKCPECEREISDQAPYCPHCGKPMETTPPETKLPPDPRYAPLPENHFDDLEEQQAQSVLIEANAQKKRRRLWFAIGGGVLALLALFIVISETRSFKMTADNVPMSGLYNSTLGVGVKIGQEKADVDKLLGKPTVQYGDYVYEGNLTVTYTDGEVSALYVVYPNDRWATKGGITIDSPTDNLIAEFGEPLATEQSGFGYKEYYNANLPLVLGLQHAGGKVKSIYIYDQTKVETAS